MLNSGKKLNILTLTITPHQVKWSVPYMCTNITTKCNTTQQIVCKQF